MTCLELHTYSSLNMEYIPLYKGTLKEADQAMVYYNPAVVKQKRLPELSPTEIKKQFGKEDLMVYNDSEQLEEALKNLDENTCVLSADDIRKLLRHGPPHPGQGSGG